MTCSFEENNFMEYKDILARKEKKTKNIYIYILKCNTNYLLIGTSKKKKKKMMKLTV